MLLLPKRAQGKVCRWREAPSPKMLESHLPATFLEDTKGSEVTPMSASSLYPTHTGSPIEMKNPWGLSDKLVGTLHPPRSCYTDTGPPAGPREPLKGMGRGSKTLGPV
ncbi:hypothetical protein I79_011664 [Cricetulus griseus]|uniref:Uncharacterized protein n=1 Tax=Cricetulus griseus TaxID=10029 RepID=G3HLS0_CRIGR|nr:hypothetical protein I79_011664 [Cricetulus griseus]